MEAESLRIASHRGRDSDEEYERDLSTHFYPSPVQRAWTTEEESPRVRTLQVTGSIIRRNLSSSELGETPRLPTGKTGPPLTEYTLSTSSSDEESLKDEVAKSKLEESTPLLVRVPRHNQRRRWRRHFVCLSAALLLLLLVIPTIATVFYCDYRPLHKSEKTAILRNLNDTIIAADVDTKITRKVSLQLLQQATQSLHVVHLHSTPCNKLKIHSTIDRSATDLIIEGAINIFPPDYLVAGSTINIAAYVLNASPITVEIELYVFSGLSLLKNFAANLEKGVYRATIYISQPGVQNSSTFINYTVPSTDYYFLVVDSTSPIRAEFDITVDRNYFDPADYKQSCVIQDQEVCELSYSNSFHDRQECVLAHVAYVPDAQWVPAYIEVRKEPQRLTETAVTVMSSVGGISLLLSLTTLTFCGFYCLCKRVRNGST